MRERRCCELHRHRPARRLGPGVQIQALKRNYAHPYYSVVWSYPSSPNAEKAGHARTGCWTVYRCSGYGDTPLKHFPPTDRAAADKLRTELANPAPKAIV